MFNFNLCLHILLCYDKMKFMNGLSEILKSSSYKKFSSIIDANKLNHAYLFCSPDEEYNNYFCKVVALKLICEKFEPCFNCDDCKKFLSNFHPDVLEYPKGPSLLVSDSSSIIENAEIKPMLSNYKIFIINNFDKSTQQAQNKLLKTLEESPKNVIFLLNSTNTDNILQTIKSRTQIFKLEPLSMQSVLNFYKSQNIVVSDIALEMGEGWLGKTLNLTSGNFKECYDFVLKLVNEMKNSRVIIKFAPIFAKKENFLINLTILQELMEEILYINLGLKENEQIKSAEEFKVEAISEIFDLIDNAKKQFKANVNTNLITDFLLFKILEVKYKWNKTK